MTVFDEREKAYENKYMREEEVRFKATAFAVRVVATDIAQKIGLTGDAVSAFAAKIIAGPLVEDGLDAALQALFNETKLCGASLSLSDIQIAFERTHQDKMAELMGMKSK
jgi:hypothetical protein